MSQGTVRPPFSQEDKVTLLCLGKEVISSGWFTTINII